MMILTNTIVAQDKAGIKEKLDASLVLETESAYEFNSRSIQKSEWILTPEVRYKLNKNFKFVGIGRLYTEVTDKLEPRELSNNSSSALSGRKSVSNRLELELREFYVDYWNGKGFSARVGKQQIVWGETDGLKLLDVVNPQYFREFVLDDFDDSRIPLWSVKAQFEVTPFLDAELLWIPDQTYHNLPSQDGKFFPGRHFLPLPPTGISTRLAEATKPGDIFSDSDAGIKLSSFVKGWDISVNYLYHYQDLPVFHQNLVESTILISPRYDRQHLAGMSFNKALGAFVLRGESVWRFDQAFVTNDITQNQGIAETDQVQTALGLDWIGGESFISAQLFDDLIINDIDVYNRDQLVWSGSALFRQEFFNDNLNVETLLVHDFNRGDGMVRPKLKYLLQSNVVAHLGADFFYGSTTGLFGQFNKRDRIFAGLTIGL